MQLIQTPGGDYVNWPKINYSIFEGNDMDHWYITKDIILKVLYYTQTKKLFTYQKTNHDNLLFLCFWSLPFEYTLIKSYTSFDYSYHSYDFISTRGLYKMLCLNFL